MPKLNIYSTSALPINSETAILKGLPKKQKIVLISPHSDDISVSCGSTAVMLSSQNQLIPFLFFTGYRGVKGKNKQEAIKIREREMAKEAKALKISPPLFLRLKTYENSSTEAVNRDVAEVKKYLNKEKPDIIFLPKKDDLHPRHKIATDITLKAIQFPCRLFFYENPWSAIGAFEFNSVFVFSKKELKHQLKAIRAHKSQLKRTAFDKAAKALAEFRGAVVPEQRIFGYGNNGSRLKDVYIEAFEEVDFKPL